MDYMNKYRDWINNKIIDEGSKNELLEIQDNDNEIQERFHKNLEFGTGGLRGVIGVGTNRINVYTIRKATQGLANFINITTADKDEKCVAIAYDSRHFSDVFAEEAALVLAANNIKAYVFESLRPTPELSFAVRHLNCDAGIVITASHNPPEYNGYKVYGADGGQITLETANSIISEINQLEIFDDIKVCSKDDAIKRGFISYLGEEIDNEYLDNVTNLSFHPNLSKDVVNFKIVYTPLHGTGLMPIERALSILGYDEVHIVESQKFPDGNFPTIKSPNPEEEEALTEGIKLANEIDADIVLGTDPDSDRVGVAVRGEDGTFELLTGNQIGALLTHYIVSNQKIITHRDAVVKTIVTSELGANIARAYGATVFETLTGFKFIGEIINEFEKDNNYNFLIGYEESYGYLVGTFVRDKDAVISSVLIVEIAAFYKRQGKTLLDAMNEIYQEFGFYTDALESYTFKGIDGQEKIKSVVSKFRDSEDLLNSFSNIRSIEDYKIQEKYDIKTSIVEKLFLPSSNVVKIYFDDDSWFAVRPSGTEPKLKIYFSTKGSTKEEANIMMMNLKKQINKYIKE